LYEKDDNWQQIESRGRMRADQFQRRRQADWERLTRLLNRTRDGSERLSTAEVEELARLYRSATSDLALAQRDFPRHPVTAYLNGLVGRTHALLYRGEPLAYRRLVRFATHGFPRAYRAALPFVLAATLLFFLPALLSGLIAAYSPESARWLLPQSVQQLIPTIEGQELWTDIPVHERPFASSFIMTNNIQVAFLAFAGGALAGTVTVWVLLLNGLVLGGITGLTAHYGLAFDLWTFVIGHGVIELSVICMAGGSGLMMGWALLRPGLLRRRAALTLAARRSLRLLAGCVPLLLIAGAVEGFISPAESLPWFVKWGVGLGSGALLYAYLFLAGRGPDPATTTSAP
jgi:uncharacterized membrane protein SpoIIM required for sporulation